MGGSPDTGTTVEISADIETLTGTFPVWVAASEPSVFGDRIVSNAGSMQGISSSIECANHSFLVSSWSSLGSFVPYTESAIRSDQNNSPETYAETDYQPYIPSKARMRTKVCLERRPPHLVSAYEVPHKIHLKCCGRYQDRLLSRYFDVDNVALKTPRQFDDGTRGKRLTIPRLLRAARKRSTSPIPSVNIS